MFRPTLALSTSRQATRKLQLTPKKSPKDYYKGYGSGAMGTHTKHGGYKLDFAKVRTYVVPPDLDSSHLTPFVAKKVDLPTKKSSELMTARLNGEELYKAWKESGTRA